MNNNRGTEERRRASNDVGSRNRVSNTPRQSEGGGTRPRAVQQANNSQKATGQPQRVNSVARRGTPQGQRTGASSVANVQKGSSQMQIRNNNSLGTSPVKEKVISPIKRKKSSPFSFFKKKKAKKPSSYRGYNRNDDYSSENTGNTAITSLLKAIVYIMSILVVSGFLSYFAITAGNDIFAFVKSDEEITVTIGAATDIKDLGKILEEKGVIKYANVFDLYAKLRKKNPELEAGEYTVSPSMGYDELIAVFAKQNIPERTTVIVTIPEGYTVDKIIDTLVNKYGLSTREELVDAIQNYDFDYWFVDRLEESGTDPNRKYRLEGYLYPDTYYYYSDSSAETILYKMLDNFDKKLKDIFKDDNSVPGADYIEKLDYLCKKHNMTFDEAMILASMIQMEAKYMTEYPRISGVFHNRLNNPSATNGLLESCATVLYFLDIRVPILSEEQTKIDNPYNTYMYKGLPPGCISNPAQEAIIYALYPEKNKYYYFVAGNDGYSLFAKTYKEHQKNIASLKQEE